jgi:3-oxoacyl-[acyl-carrier protein] reductase
MPDKSVAIVTGASQGIGRATAIRLAGDFEAVVLAARQENELSKTADAIKAAGAEPQIDLVEMTDPQWER